ncbi:oligosaccharide flippase family protein [Rhodococcus sp. CSLK01-03]|uniref:Oligosaccharide flippase family protein n=1 Tax=Rhodococcus indonesiensis TaxID=3055869 RepID=A0ABT7RHY2_9NOCA|nr:oligosaccharide flippase family protein [Rhodococcus indonesiensis]MDM7486854.1 oligosaccharide flippase family protein [Rhodococcus indonesiensis]
MIEERGTNKALALMRDIGFVSFGKYGQYVVTAVTLPLIARVLGPEGLGLLAIGMSAYFIGSLLVDLGITQFLAAKVPNSDVNQIRGDYLAIRLGVLGTLGTALVAGLVLGVDPHVHMILLGLFAGGFWSVSEDWVLIGQGRFVASTVYQGVGRLAYLALLLVVLPRFPSASVALLCMLASSTLTVALTWRDSLRKYGRPARPRRVAPTVRMAAPVFTSRLLVVSYGQGAAAIYSAVLDAASLGLYSAGDRLVRAVQSMLDPIGFALLPRLARSSGDARFWRRTTLAMLACVGIAVLVAAALWIVAPLAVRLVFGSDFAGAVPLLRVEVLILPATALSSFVTTAVLPVREDTTGVLIGSIIGTCIAAVALYSAFRTHSVWALVYGTVACEFGVALWYVLRTRHLVLRERRIESSGADVDAADVPVPRGEKR